MTNRLLGKKNDINTTISYSQTPTPYHAVIAQEIVKSFKDGEIFDHGCGVGNTLIELERLAPESYKYTLSDIDPNCLKIAQEHLNVEKTYLISEDGVLPIIDDKFDAVISSHVVHYDKHFDTTIRQLISMVRPGGLFVLAVPNAMTLPLFFNALIRKKHSTAPIIAWDIAAFTNLMSVLDLAEVDIMTDYAPLPFLTRYKFFKPVERALVKLFPGLGFSLIAKCTVK